MIKKLFVAFLAFSMLGCKAPEVEHKQEVKADPVADDLPISTADMIGKSPESINRYLKPHAVRLRDSSRPPLFCDNFQYTVNGERKFIQVWYVPTEDAGEIVDEVVIGASQQCVLY